MQNQLHSGCSLWLLGTSISWGRRPLLNIPTYVLKNNLSLLPLLSSLLFYFWKIDSLAPRWCSDSLSPSFMQSRLANPKSPCQTSWWIPKELGLKLWILPIIPKLELYFFCKIPIISVAQSGKLSNIYATFALNR